MPTALTRRQLLMRQHVTRAVAHLQGQRREITPASVALALGLRADDPDLIAALAWVMEHELR